MASQVAMAPAQKPSLPASRGEQAVRSRQSTSTAPPFPMRGRIRQRRRSAHRWRREFRASVVENHRHAVTHRNTRPLNAVHSSRESGRLGILSYRVGSTVTPREDSHMTALKSARGLPHDAGGDSTPNEDHDTTNSAATSAAQAFVKSPQMKILAEIERARAAKRAAR